MGHALQEDYSAHIPADARLEYPCSVRRSAILNHCEAIDRQHTPASLHAKPPCITAHVQKSTHTHTFAYAPICTHAHRPGPWD